MGKRSETRSWSTRPLICGPLAKRSPPVRDLLSQHRSEKKLTTSYGCGEKWEARNYCLANPTAQGDAEGQMGAYGGYPRNLYKSNSEIIIFGERKLRAVVCLRRGARPTVNNHHLCHVAGQSQTTQQKAYLSLPSPPAYRNAILVDRRRKN